MAIKLPTVERIDPIAPQSQAVGQVNVPGAAQGIGMVNDQLQRLGKTAIVALTEIENQKINAVSNEMQYKYNEWWNTKIQGDSKNNVRGLRHIEGDPTEAYNQFDVEAEEFRKQLVEESGLNDRGKNLVKSSLAGLNNRLTPQRLLYFGQQFAGYKTKATEARVQAEKQNAMNNLQTLDLNDPTMSLAGFNQSLNGMQQARITNFLDNGLANYDEKGLIEYIDPITNEVRKVTLSDQAGVKLSKDLSDTVSNSIAALAFPNTLEQAEFMMEKYGSAMDPVAKAKVQEKIDKTKIDTQATIKLSQLSDKSFAEQKKIIDEMPTDTVNNIKIKQAALQQLDANEKYIKSIRNADSTEAYGTLFTMVDDRQRSSSPYQNTYEMERDPMVSALLDRVTNPEQRKAIYNVIEGRDAKKISPIDDLNKMMDMVAEGEGLYGMSGQEFHQLTSRMNQTDYGFFRRIWEKTNLDSEYRKDARASKLTKTVNELWKTEEYIRAPFGRETKESELARIKMGQTIVENYSHEFQPNMTPGERTRRVREIILSERNAIEEQMNKNKSGLVKFFNRITSRPTEPVRTIREGGTTVVPDAPKQGPKSSSLRATSFTTKEIAEIREAYRQEHNNQDAPNVKTLMKWYSTKVR